MRGLSLEDRYRFAMSPCNTRNPAAMASLLHFATAYAARTPVPLDLAVPDRVPGSSEELKRLEETYQVRCSGSLSTPCAQGQPQARCRRRCRRRFCTHHQRHVIVGEHNWDLGRASKTR